MSDETCTDCQRPLITCEDWVAGKFGCVADDPSGQICDCVSVTLARVKTELAESERKLAEAIAVGTAAYWHDRFSRCLTMLEESERKVARLEAERDELLDLVAGSVPLTWAATGDTHNAGEWEKRAADILAREAKLLRLR